MRFLALSIRVRAGRGGMVGVGAKEFVVIAIPLASMSSLCRARLSVTRQNSSSVILLCEISTMSPGVMGGLAELAASIQLLGMWLVMDRRMVSQRLVLKEVPDLSYLFAWQICLRSSPVIGAFVCL